ncbi:Gp157 family protein (plasmid) [Nitrosococcus halophilus Nc 4]|uniref:Gp157 family protein n=1 Tax=Nitrosococcus halophilus (strain Nc4) TaxID=472759 RepID=D5C5E2_NITHN|nr:siphovirus Gp157 family protein [Nitrosococcus halophilus]ADE16996.1 Gp157 family protein [Nitrosococcus halophilus Nc 4]
MSTLRLYKIANDYLEALEGLAEIDDLPGEVIADTLEGLQGAFEIKARHVAAYIRSIEAEASAIKEARKAMEQRERSMVRHAERLRGYLETQMERTGITRIGDPELLLKIQPSPPKVVIDDEKLVPVEYKEDRVETVVLKSEISKALKAGEQVPGAHLEQGRRLVIA